MELSLKQSQLKDRLPTPIRCESGNGRRFLEMLQVYDRNEEKQTSQRKTQTMGKSATLGYSPGGPTTKNAASAAFFVFESGTFV